MHKIRLLLILTAALLLAGAEERLGQAPAAEAAFPGTNGKIAISQCAGEVCQITVMKSDGSAAEASIPGLYPSWSPDGQKIAFMAVSQEISVMNHDGSEQRSLGVVGSGPGWSPDGSQIAFHTGGGVEVINADGTGLHTVTSLTTITITPARWSPDGEWILFTGYDGSSYDLYKVHPDGTALTNITDTPGPRIELFGNWSPDGTKIVYADAVSGSGEEYDLYTIGAEGSGRQYIAEGGGFPAWSPDGERFAFWDFSPADSTQAYVMNTDGSGLTPIPGTTGDFIGATIDWQPIPSSPIVFIHGFMGSRINCAGSELWPNISLLPPSGPDLPQMMLADDGVSPALGACDASVGDILDEVLGGSIYQTAIDFLDGLAPGNVSYFNWDWRKSPEPSLVLLDDLIADIQEAHEGQKVVLVGHSYGGLLARWYVDDASRADNVERVVTIGTPAWGSPKSLFQLYAGIATPDLTGLDLFMDNEDLHELAKNLFGDYFLYPSVSYGPWLKLHPSSTPVNRQGLLDYVTELGGNAALLDQALAAHTSILDSVPNGVDFEVIVGAGLPTIAEVGVTPDGFLLIDYSNGDGTVPVRSAARGVAGPTNPNAAHTHYSCGVGHVHLPGDPQVTDAIKDFLLTGGPIEGLQDSPCPANGIQFRLFDLPSAAAAAPAGVTTSSGGPMSLEDAVFQGVVDYLDLPEEKFIITGTTFPEVALPEGRFLQVTPILDGAKGQSQVYGPLEGQVSISADGTDAAVFVDGVPIEPSPGDPHTWGDNDCDGEISSRDNQALLRTILQQPPLSQTQPCPALGDVVAVSGIGDRQWGDLDCDGEITSRDNQAMLRKVLQQPPLSQTQPCPLLGDAVTTAAVASVEALWRRVDGSARGFRIYPN